MNVPRAEIDPRYGNDGMPPTDWADVVRVLQTAGVFWITTLRPGGGPHVTPLVAVWSNDRLNFCFGVGEQKDINVQADPRVAMTTGTNSWDGGLDVVIEGEAVAVTDTVSLKQLAEVWTTVWDGRWDYEVGDGCFHHPGSTERVLVFTVEPSTAYAFAKSPFSQTRYRFASD
jgi:nitroimidazol reductase NimA-like FMN-containing flavoprotein (pyridoxamine 5'-phosphate oxidase superfamily)